MPADGGERLGKGFRVAGPSACEERWGPGGVSTAAPMDDAADAEGAPGVLPRSTRSHRVDAGKKGVVDSTNGRAATFFCFSRKRERAMFRRGLASLRCMSRSIVLDTVDNFDWSSY